MGKHEAPWHEIGQRLGKRVVRHGRNQSPETMVGASNAPVGIALDRHASAEVPSLSSTPLSRKRLCHTRRLPSTTAEARRSKEDSEVDRMGIIRYNRYQYTLPAGGMDTHPRKLGAGLCLKSAFRNEATVGIRLRHAQLTFCLLPVVASSKDTSPIARKASETPHATRALLRSAHGE